MKPATERICLLRAKLQALADRGVNGEKIAAQVKLKRLERHWDFSKPVLRTEDIFAGTFRRSTQASPVMTFTATDYDVANSVKWAIEQAAGIPCLYRDGVLMAEATPETANRLHSIAGTVSASYGELWKRFAGAPGVSLADRNVFMLGLFEGMMGDTREGQALPSRSRDTKTGKAKKKAVGMVAGISLHPYSVALELGKQIRFSVPLDDLTGQLDRTIKGELAA